MEHHLTTDTLPANPRREPDWRWRRAGHIVANGKYASRRREDIPTRAAVAFLRECLRCSSDRQWRSLKRRFPFACQAVCLRQEGRRQLELRARILAGQTDTSVGLSMDLHPATVQAFRHWFYDVGDRIRCAGFILYRVIGLHPATVPTPEQLLLFSAYRFGPLTIEPFLDYLDHGADWQDLQTPTGITRARIDVWVMDRTLVETPEIQFQRLNLAPYLVPNSLRAACPGTVAGHFSDLAARILQKSALPDADPPPFAYSPGHCNDQTVIPGRLDGLEMPEMRGQSLFQLLTNS